MHACIYLSIYPSICLPAYLSAYLSACLSFYLFPTKTDQNLRCYYLKLTTYKAGAIQYGSNTMEIDTCKNAPKFRARLRARMALEGQIDLIFKMVPVEVVV